MQLPRVAKAVGRRLSPPPASGVGALSAVSKRETTVPSVQTAKCAMVVVVRLLKNTP